MSESIVYLPKPGLAGLSRIQFLPVDDLESSQMQPIPMGHVLSSPLVLVPGASFLDIYSTRGRAILEIQDNSDRHGELYRVIVRGVYPGKYEDIAAKVGKYKKTRHIVIATQLNGASIILGLNSLGLEFNFNYSTGQAHSDEKGISYSFEYSCLNLPPLYQPL